MILLAKNSAIDLVKKLKETIMQREKVGEEQMKRILTITILNNRRKERSLPSRKRAGSQIIVRLKACLQKDELHPCFLHGMSFCPQFIK